MTARAPTTTTNGPGTALIRGDARSIPLADDSVDLIVTSPPFLNLRSYTDAGQHYAGQIGSEATREDFLDELWTVTAECARVLKPSGSMFVELGDSYTDKSLNLTPHRYAIGCIDKLGLLLRAEIIWDRPNGLPESVTDRVRRSHSCWFHLVKQPRYYSAIDEVREPHADHTLRYYPPGGAGQTAGPAALKRAATTQTQTRAVNFPDAVNPLGKLPGSVWSIASEPLRVPEHLGVTHYAAFSSEWPRRLILGFSPPGICTGCGEGRVPVVEREREKSRPVVGSTYGGNGRKPNTGDREAQTATILGYACPCTPSTRHAGTGESSGAKYAESLNGGNGYLAGWHPPPTRPAVVLDPFSGTGTTPMVAKTLGRYGIGLDLSWDYCRLGQWRVNASGHHAKALARTNLERQGAMF